MKLKKQQENEVLKVYNTWWESYLNGDVKTYDSYLDDDFRFVGSTNGEEFLNRQDTTDFFKATADQLAGKAELRNTKRTIELVVDNHILITDLADAYVISDSEWVFYSRFRFSSLLRKNREGWRFIYQHFSAPDIKAQEGETLGFEKISQENLELREAIKRRTVELEHKNRELEIEAALERVRSRTMAMHKSNELADTAKVMIEQLSALGINTYALSIGIFHPDKQIYDVWISPTGELIDQRFEIPYGKDVNFNTIYQAWLNQEESLAQMMTGERLLHHLQFLVDNGFPAHEFITMFKVGKIKKHHIDSIFFKHGSLDAVSPFENLNEENKSILKRFAKVFEQTYTRFLDLQKAEAQVRESEIELALERVRARTMAMQHSDELADASFLLDSQIRALGIKTRGCAFNIYGENDSTEWFSSEMGTMPVYKTPRENIFLRYYEEGKKGKSIYIDSFEGEACAKHYDYLCTLPVMGEALKKMKESGGSFPTQQIDHVTYFKYGYLLFITLEPVPQEHDTFIRFAKVFEQTYTRFLDLQKAEAQTREAQIEAALEKVRSSSLAMHNSDQIREIVKVVFEKLKDLKFAIDGGAFVATMSKNSDSLNFWIGDDQAEYPNCFNFPQYDAPTITDVWNAKKAGVDFISKTYSFKEKNIWFEYAFNNTDLKTALPEDFKKWILEQEYLTQSFAMQKNSMVGVHFHHAKTLTENEIDILKRFSRVFEQSYVRFLDLQKAEAQAREAQIEAALERVRSRSLAMRNSAELQEVISVVFQQMQSLGIKADASLINILTDDSRDFYLWIGTGVQAYAQKIRIPYIKHPVFDVFYDARDRGETFMANALTREEKDSFFEYAFQYSDLKLMPSDRKKYVMDSAGFARSFAWSKNSGITVQNYAGIPYTDHENEILKRFAQVFEQAYTRFLDVKNAEAQTREAIKQATLERVRGEIASMRTTEDLKLITPLIWKELNTLGVPFIRCGVFIVNENRRTIQTFLSTPNGDSLSAFEMPFENKEVASGLLKHWKLNEIYYDNWDKKQFVSFMQNLIDSGQIKDSVSFQGTSAPPELLYLNFVPFKQGMLYVGNIAPIKQEELQLVQALAKTFSVAYARYEDFKNLEDAKNKIELTLTELKATQAQLIQSEKMASLGELTAGIAHEIQNPLNFVNNFSEISKELLDEMKEEIDKGDLEEVKEIANDVIQNLVKINHHGKRAEGIVKGMLQHSRTSTGQKELTDVNVLADECLRLSFHGLRAKDKSFNADFKTEFDETLPKINVIPQDIGRVLLNLINNAFYAVDKRAKELTPLIPPKGGTKNDQIKYRPAITVSTASLNPPSGGRGVKISVKDNGSGIPHNIVDKIFQPFFTTKPTGSGTGLGLSLSYDIIKAHGGEIKVESTENKGTAFTISLPQKQ